MSATAEQRGESTAGGRITHDECFDLLSNHRRRYTLHYLQQNGSTATLGELSEYVAAWENDTAVDDLSYDERKRVYTSLQQVHLPRMDEANVVRFDDREGVVEIGPAADDLDIYLEIVQGRDVPWSVFYFGLAVMNALVVGAFAIGLWPIASLPEMGVSVFVVTAFLVVSLAHLYITRAEMRLGNGETPPGLTK